MVSWKSTVAFCLIAALPSCHTTARMSAMDRALVKKQVAQLPAGGVQITLAGDLLHNPTAAIESFHTFAEKEMRGRPYRYSYTVEGAKATPSPPAPKERGQSGSYIPIYTQPGAGSGEMAVVVGSLALLLIVADAMKKHDEKTGRPLSISGTAQPIAPVSWDRQRLVEVAIPEAPPVIGKVDAKVRRALAESIRSAFESLGSRVIITDQPREGGYFVKPTVLRAQGHLFQACNLTVECAITDKASGSEIARFLVQANERPMDIKAQTERQQNSGIAPGILVKPLEAKLRTYLQSN